MTTHVPPGTPPNPTDDAASAEAPPRPGVCPVLRAYAQRLAGRNWPAQDDFPAALGGALAALAGTAGSAATERARAVFLAASQIAHCDHGCDLSEGLAGLTRARRLPMEAALRAATRAYIATLRVDANGEGEPRVLRDDATAEERAAWDAEGAALVAAYRTAAEAFVATVIDGGVAPVAVAALCATYLDDSPERSNLRWALAILGDAATRAEP